MSKLKGFFVLFDTGHGEESVAVDDDGRVAYAYVLDGDGTICADVWLYNRCAAPAEPEWTSPDNAPFANPEAYVSADTEFRLPSSPEDFAVQWATAGDGSDYVEIFIRDRLAAKLTRGAKPGWSAGAAKDGPLAKVLLPDIPC